jgi:hypothetical protein
MTLNGSGSATSASTGKLPSGSYYFMVTYSGNATYPAITVATAEPFVVGPADLSTTPTVTGTSASDAATVTGSLGTPTGTVTFVLYSGAYSNGTATGYTDTVTLSGGAATSKSTGTLATGSYYFLATYNGDSTYSALAPLPEPFTIISTSASKSTPTYKIPTKAPQTGAGGSAGVVFNGGLLALGSSMLLAGLAAMALMIRRRRLA